MYEKLGNFLSSIIIVLCVAVICFAYLKLFCRKHKEKLNSVSWVKENPWRIFVFLGVPVNYVWTPFVEEFVFRMPLIVIFDTLSVQAWLAIIFSGAIFAVANTKYFLVPKKIFGKQDGGESDTDDFVLTASQIDKEKEEDEDKAEKTTQIIRVLLSFVLGLLAGYLGIKYQSIWLAIGIHLAFNILTPIVVLLALLIVSGMSCVIYIIGSQIRLWMQR